MKDEVLFLTREEEKMYSGEEGPVLEWALKLLVEYGEALGAECMLDLDGPGGGGIPLRLPERYLTGVKVRWEIPRGYAEYVRRNGFKIPIWNLQGRIDLDNWKEYNYTEEEYNQYLVAYEELEKLAPKLGITPSYTCTPYHVGFIPHFGSHTATAESSLVTFVNSVAGARCMRNSAPVISACQITGKAPAADLHLDENRGGSVLFRVETNLLEDVDYDTLGLYAGEIVGSDVAVFTGIPKDVTLCQLKQLNASIAVGGSVGLYHAVGITPEATNLDAAFRGEKPLETLIVGRDELLYERERMCTGGSEKIDLVNLGCPHSSIRQLRNYAMLLEGRKVHENVKLWIHTAPDVISAAERTGIASTIKAAGGILLGRTCPVMRVGFDNSLWPKIFPEIKVVATDSGKQAYCNPFRLGGVDVWFGTAKQCIDAAVTGRWS